MSSRDRLIVLSVAPGGRVQVAYADADFPVQSIADVLSDDAIASRTVAAYKNKVKHLAEKELRDTIKSGLSEYVYREMKASGANCLIVKSCLRRYLQIL